MLKLFSLVRDFIFFGKARYIVNNRFIIFIQLYNDYVLSTLLPPHELSRDFLHEKEYVSEILQKTTFLKIWTTYISVLNSKNMSSSKNCYETVETVEIHSQLEETGDSKLPL